MAALAVSLAESFPVFQFLVFLPTYPLLHMVYS